MKNNIFKYLALILILSAGCQKDYELEKSVFIDDIENPGLPIYSEWGYNTFGANFDREVFVSNDYKIPMKVISNSGGTSFLFS